MKKLILTFLSLALVAGVTLAKPSHFPDISHQELTSAIAAKSVVVIDVNGSDSFKAGHIPGAIDYIANKDRLAKLLPADKSALVVAYCRNEQCGAYGAAARAAAELGYTNVKHYAAGIDGWKKSGAPLEKAS